MNKLLRGVLLAAGITAIFTLVSVGVHDTGMDAAMPANPALNRIAVTYNRHAIDTAISLLRTGNVVLRTGLGPGSQLLARMNQKDKTYSHCGIVQLEHGYPFVYHSIGGEDNPDARLRKDSAQLFFSDRCNSGLAIVAYDFSPGQLISLQQQLAFFYKARPRFDMQFDMATDDRLYCSEFVYKAITRAVGDTAYLSSTYTMGYHFVGTDDLFTGPHAHTVMRLRFK